MNSLSSFELMDHPVVPIRSYLYKEYGLYTNIILVVISYISVHTACIRLLFDYPTLLPKLKLLSRSTVVYTSLLRMGQVKNGLLYIR